MSLAVVSLCAILLRHLTLYCSDTLCRRCYSVRFSFELLGALCGTFLYNKDSWGWGVSYSAICLSLVAFIVCVLPFLIRADEIRPAGATAESGACGVRLAELWGVVQLRAAWKPMLYIFSYNLFQVFYSSHCQMRWCVTLPNALVRHTAKCVGASHCQMRFSRLAVGTQIKNGVGLVLSRWVGHEQL